MTIVELDSCMQNISKHTKLDFLKNYAKLPICVSRSAYSLTQERILKSNEGGNVIAYNKGVQTFWLHRL